MCITILSRSWCLTVFLRSVLSAVARALPCVCLVTRTHVSLLKFDLKFHCRKCPLQNQVNWKQSTGRYPGAYLDLSHGMKVNEYHSIRLNLAIVFSQVMKVLLVYCCRLESELNCL